MKAITLSLLLCLLAVAGCVDADDEQPKPYSSAVSNLEQRSFSSAPSGPDTSRTVSYLSEKPWKGWEESPERVKVTVRSAGERHTHYFESLPLAYGWLPERYDKFDILEMLVANALSGNDLLDFDNAYFVTSRGLSSTVPVVLAYPTREDAVVAAARYPDRYTALGWSDLDRRIDSWRADYWDDWRDDFGFVRTPTVAHIDGTFWDGWYTTPDRVLIRASDAGKLSSYYFDSLPVAWSWIEKQPSLDLVDLQVAAADGSLRLLPAREATFVWMSSDSSALPAALAFATHNDAARYLDALGYSAFSLADWNDLKPRLTSWSEEHWNDWRGNPEHNRGIARALEAGLGNKLGLRRQNPGVVAGEHQIRERNLEKDHRLDGKAGNAKGNSKTTAKSKPADKHRASGKAKVNHSGRQHKSRGNSSRRSGRHHISGKAKGVSPAGHKARGGSHMHNSGGHGWAGGGSHGGKGNHGGKK